MNSCSSDSRTRSGGQVGGEEAMQRLLAVMRYPCEIVSFLLHNFNFRTRYPDEISCFLGSMRYLDEISWRFTRGLVWWSDVCNLKNVFILWAVTVF